jgi:pyruvate dehydrogenase E2 component (dihydrolipoamide acetyltransferase)
MKKEIKIPDIAENVDSGVIGRILVSKGDEIKKDQPVVEVETDKAATDIPSPFDGTIDEIKVEEGDEVTVGQVIMIVEVAGDGGAEDEGQKDDREAEKEDQEDKQEERDADGKSASGKKTAAEDIPAAPSVRRMAREAGINLAEVRGTGPGKRITADDITSAKKEKEGQSGEGNKEKAKDVGSRKKEGDAQKEGSPAREGAIELPDFSQWGATKKEKLNTVRRITARTMTASWQQIPQVTQFDEADITEIEAFRQKHKEQYEKKGGKLTVTAILLKIAAYALQKFPRFNASLDTSDQTLVMKQYINIGIAVDTDKGLIVPVIRDTDKKSLEKISVETGI